MTRRICFVVAPDEESGRYQYIQRHREEEQKLQIKKIEYVFLCFLCGPRRKIPFCPSPRSEVELQPELDLP